MAEFEPIIRRRNYNVRSVSEFCCCGDGLDFEPGSRRKRPKQPNNLLGYNQTSSGRFGKFHTIHIRLRSEANHAVFKLYEDVAGTMAHELAHCVVGPHNDKFNKLMDEIIDEHASLMASNLTRNGMPMLAFGTTGQVLGGQRISLQDSRKKQQAQNIPGRVLGGDSSFIQWMTPREAAVAAADARRRQERMRLRGDLCCRPCLDGLEQDDEDVDVVEVVSATDATQPKTQPTPADTKVGDRKKRPNGAVVFEDVENRKPRAKVLGGKPLGDKRSSSKCSGDIIDLTGDDDDTPVVSLPVARTWSCGKCTFLNQHVATACDVCLAVRE